MSASGDLYRAVVLTHGRQPRNVGRLADASHAADGDNPLCGDSVHVDVACRDDVVAGVRFTGESCVVATASASLMSERVAGLAVDEARRLIAVMTRFCATGDAAVFDGVAPIGDLAAFADVHRHRVRIGCATLPWRTLARALGD